jgi:hypothetical protein
MLAGANIVPRINELPSLRQRQVQRSRWTDMFFVPRWIFSTARKRSGDSVLALPDWMEPTTDRINELHGPRVETRKRLQRRPVL